MPWDDDAPCKGRGELFFAPQSDGYRAARRICHACPVAAACLAEALETEPTNSRCHAGMRAGLTPVEITTMIRERTRAREAEHGTTAGFYRHRRDHTPLCDPCKDARAAYQSAYRKKLRAAGGAA